MGRVYPFSWKENTEEEQNRRAKYWTAHNSIAVRSMVSYPMEVNMPAFFVERNVHTRIWDMKPRPDDIWLVTYPKSGTTMAQELLWQMSTGCNVNSEESKKQIYERSPYIEGVGFSRKCCNNECEECEMSDLNLPKLHSFLIDPVVYAEGLKGPRIIKTHLPLSMLPPDLLEVSKVVALARNPKDACVSLYHHVKLFPHHGWDHSAQFEDFANFYMEGRTSYYGNYWVHLKVYYPYIT